MKSVSVVLGVVLISVTAMADQKATITCVGENITFTEKSSYLGENSTSAQSLIVISRTGSDDSANAAYFLDVDMEGDVDSNYMIYSVGKNKQGGKFLLKTRFWQDVGDGTVISQKTTGVLSVSHGPIKIADEPVNCTKE